MQTLFFIHDAVHNSRCVNVYIGSSTDKYRQTDTDTDTYRQTDTDTDTYRQTAVHNSPCVNVYIGSGWRRHYIYTAVHNSPCVNVYIVVATLNNIVVQGPTCCSGTNIVVFATLYIEQQCTSTPLYSVAKTHLLNTYI